MGKGQTFLSDDETPRGIIKHLKIVISDADEEGEYLVVGVTTWHEGLAGQDASCILEAGCHEFIRHKSWIDFTRSKAMSYTKIFNGLRKGILIKKSDMDMATIERIQKAARESDFFPTELERFFGYF